MGQMGEDMNRGRETKGSGTRRESRGRERGQGRMEGKNQGTEGGTEVSELRNDCGLKRKGWVEERPGEERTKGKGGCVGGKDQI